MGKKNSSYTMGFTVSFFLITLIILSTTKSQTVISVKRATGSFDGDQFVYSGNCLRVCAQTNGFQTSSCTCKCHTYQSFSIADNKCLSATADDSIILDNSDTPKFGISKVTRYLLQSNGVRLHYCPKNKLCSSKLVCKINKLKSVYDNFEWKIIWPGKVEPDFVIETINGRDTLKLLKSSNRYSGMLLRINFDCAVNGNANSINAFAMIAIQGLLTKKEILDGKTTLSTIKPTIDLSVTTKHEEKNTTRNKKVVKKKEDSKNTIAIGVAVLLLLLVIVVLAVSGYIFYKWKKDKVAFLITFNENKIVQYFQIQHQRLKKKNVRRNTDTKNTPQISNTDTVTGLEVYTVNTPSTQLPPEDKKFGTVRSLYATINKLISGKQFSDSEDTENRFFSFPKDLYNEPGMIIKKEKPKRTNIKSLYVEKNNTDDCYGNQVVENIYTRQLVTKDSDLHTEKDSMELNNILPAQASISKDVNQSLTKRIDTDRFNEELEYNLPKRNNFCENEKFEKEPGYQLPNTQSLYRNEYLSDEPEYNIPGEYITMVSTASSSPPSYTYVKNVVVTNDGDEDNLSYLVPYPENEVALEEEHSYEMPNGRNDVSCVKHKDMFKEISYAKIGDSLQETLSKMFSEESDDEIAGYVVPCLDDPQ